MENTTVLAKLPGIQASATLVIKDFLDVMVTSTPGKSYSSDTFMVGDTPLTIEVFPNGSREELKGNVSVYLCNRSDADITAKCKFITDATTKSCVHVVKAKLGLGFAKFLSHADCTNAYKDKDFIVSANVEFPAGEDLKIMGHEFSSEVPTKFDFRESLYRKMQDTNFKLVFSGSEVPCHKHILAASSPVFEAMVENQHLEAIKSVANIELSEEVGRAFVRFIYTGELKENLLKQDAVAYLELGEKYDIQELKYLAEVEMLKQLDKKNMVQFVFIGDLFNANKISEAALKMTKGNMSWLRSQV